MVRKPVRTLRGGMGMALAIEYSQQESRRAKGLVRQTNALQQLLEAGVRSNAGFGQHGV